MLALFASTRLAAMTADLGTAFKALSLDVSYSTIWASALFVLAGGLVFLFTFGVTSGIKGIDAATHGLIDLLIDTESELNKVSWPSQADLTRSTTAVLVCMVMLGVFLFLVGLLIGFAMKTMGLLPG